jgi:hypothetical protein
MSLDRHFTDSLAGTFDPGLGVAALETIDDTAPVLMRLGSKVMLTVHVDPPTLAPMQLRALPLTVLNMPEPIVAFGVPTAPTHVANLVSSSAAVSGPQNIHVVEDPNPTWDGTKWSPQPPNPSITSTDIFLRWSATEIAPNTHHPFRLGHRTPDDGTGALGDGCESWEPSAPGNPGHGQFTPAWHAVYPFKPYVHSFHHHNSDGSEVTLPRCVTFTRHWAEHMWIDLDPVTVVPFTFVIVAMVNNQFGNFAWNIMLDSGNDPTLDVSTGLSPSEAGSTALRQKILRNGLSSVIRIPTEQDYGYRVGLRQHVTRHHSQIQHFADMNPTKRISHASYPNAHRAIMMYGVWEDPTSTKDWRAPGRSKRDLGRSRCGVYYHHGKNVLHTTGIARLLPRWGKGPQFDGTARYVVLGRGNGSLNSNRASTMSVFEIRFWNKALTEAALDHEYDQLSATWKFNRFK